MALLDKKERILDITLTEKGRELLSKGELRFAFYAFSDSGVDYEKALEASDFEENVYRNFIPAETEQKKDRDITDFLYTSPLTEQALPSTNIQTENTVTLKRRYKKTKLIEFAHNVSKGIVADNVDFIMRAGIETGGKLPEKDKDIRYLLWQELNKK